MEAVNKLFNQFVALSEAERQQFGYDLLQDPHSPLFQRGFSPPRGTNGKKARGLELSKHIVRLSKDEQRRFLDLVRDDPRSPIHRELVKLLQDVIDERDRTVLQRLREKFGGESISQLGPESRKKKREKLKTVVAALREKGRTDEEIDEILKSEHADISCSRKGKFMNWKRSVMRKR